MKYTEATSIFETLPVDSGGTYFSETDNNPLDSCDSWFSEVYNKKRVIFCYNRELSWTKTSIISMKEDSVPKLSMLFIFPNHTNIFRRCTFGCRLYQVRASCPQSQVLRLISTCPRNTFRPLESLCHTDRFRVFSGSSSRFTLYWLEIYSTYKIKGFIKYKCKYYISII